VYLGTPQIKKNIEVIKYFSKTYISSSSLKRDGEREREREGIRLMLS